MTNSYTLHDLDNDKYITVSMGGDSNTIKKNVSFKRWRVFGGYYIKDKSVLIELVGIIGIIVSFPIIIVAVIP